MTIETKYNIGDKVWIYYNMGLEKMIITHINIYCRKRGDSLRVEIRYVLNSCISVCEKVLFPTKEELLKSL